MFLLKDYTPSLYNIQQTQISFHLGLEETVVRTQLLFEVSPEAIQQTQKNNHQNQYLPELFLNGEDLNINKDVDVKIASFKNTSENNNFNNNFNNNWQDWHNLNIEKNLEKNIEENIKEDIETSIEKSFENPAFTRLVKDIDYIIDDKGLKILSNCLEKYINNNKENSEKNNEKINNTKFILHICNKITPIGNKTLMGMYASNGKIFTQCEAEGFRRITYYLDRPDQMSIFSVHIKADHTLPILLSNGNLLATWKSTQSSLSLNNDFEPKEYNNTLWHDPFKKPAYLFALVAGDLVCHERHITQNNQAKLLQIWVEKADIDKTEHAMNSLEKSIAWDYTVYGLPLDLDRFMIVATHDFNMGAMENKGLNIFNAKYILAHPDMAVDVDYFNVESIIAHEYFHNWTGNRVTCRDWFQLTLKEGLTVFRDQSFSEDLQGPVTRLEGIQFLKQAQFAEDRGPMAHPIQPQAYEEINNFYTLSVYEKGAEVVRMYQTLLGKHGFMAGMQLYFARHDGQAVTCQNFLAAMRDANSDSLSPQQWLNFSNWYTQKGTPIIHYCDDYDAKTQCLNIQITQSIQAINQQDVVLDSPLCIPIAIDIYINVKNNEVIRLDHQDIKNIYKNNNINEDLKIIDQRCLLLSNQRTQTWSFDLNKLNKLINIKNIDSVDVVYLQDFSAPVLLNQTSQKPTKTKLQTATFILEHETNAYQKQQAFAQIQTQALQKLFAALKNQSLIFINIQHAYQQLKNDVEFMQMLKVYQQALLQLLDDVQTSDDFKALIVSGIAFSDFKTDLIQNQNNNQNNKSDINIGLDIQAAWQIFHPFNILWNADIYQNYHGYKNNQTSTEQKIEQRYENIIQQLKPDYDFAQINQRNLAYAYLKTRVYIAASFQDFNLFKKIQAELQIELKNMYKNAKHLSQRLAALQNLVLQENLLLISLRLPEGDNLILDQILADFFREFSHEPLVIDQWFKLQAMRQAQNIETIVEKIRELMQDAAFSDTPNRVRALLLTFFNQNMAFYSPAGLALWVDIVLRYDAQNPQLAARFARCLDDWRNLTPVLQTLIKPKLEAIQQQAKSNDVLEVIKSALQ